LGLSNLTLAGFDAAFLVRSAAAAGPLPDDHPAAALWWRILDQLPPQTPYQEAGIFPARPSHQTHEYHARAAATRTALGAACRVRPEPLKTSMPYNPYNA
jgi:hypothetical protein